MWWLSKVHYLLLLLLLSCVVVVMGCNQLVGTDHQCLILSTKEYNIWGKYICMYAWWDWLGMIDWLTLLTHSFTHSLLNFTWHDDVVMLMMTHMLGDNLTRCCDSFKYHCNRRNRQLWVLVGWWFFYKWTTYSFVLIQLVIPPPSSSSRLLDGIYW